MIALPIDDHLAEIVNQVREKRALVLVAEPGAGKTTRVPRALLEDPEAPRGDIIVVQPRRLATRSAAQRVAEEAGVKLGDAVGYTVRFDDRTSRRTRLRFVTEGILERRLVQDPSLQGVSTLIFDELHERHLSTDLSLARARLMQRQSREDLRIVAMSATLDAEPVATFLDAPIMRVPGRTYPVEIRHAPKADDRPLARQVRAAVVRLLKEQSTGDLLVFLPGASEIRRAMEACADTAKAMDLELMPLHGDLPADAQDRVLRQCTRRKVIFSTNVAETSLTIAGVVGVIDSGLAKVAVHAPWTGLASLDTVAISRASATQRAGRAGRTRAGICERLYTQSDFRQRASRDRPEIGRVDLAAMVLSLRYAGESPETFPYFEAPPAQALQAADNLLRRLELCTNSGELTEMGDAAIRLPVHPRLARAALEAGRRGYPEAGALLCALIAEREVRRAAKTQFERGHGPARSEEVASSDLFVRMDDLMRCGPRANAQTFRRAGLEVRAAQAVFRASAQLERALRKVRITSVPGEWDEEETLLLATLAAFPDRVAKRRRPNEPQLVFADGGSALLNAQSVVQDAEFVVAVEAVSRRGGVTVRLASALEREYLLELFSDALEERLEVRFDAKRERVDAESELRFGALVLDRSPTTAADAEVAQVLAQAALDKGIGRFCDAEKLERLQRRICFARIYDESIPNLDDACLRELLVRLCWGKRSFAELRDADLWSWVLGELGASARRLDVLAPETVAIPGRARVAVNYEVARPPWIASRLQDFFGATVGPSIAEGKHPLLIHLLAPNRRAVQVTTDLAGFWERHYLEVRKELRRRYPKHAWPDDPRNASPPPRRRPKGSR